jgi:hypothetical protein
MRYLKTFESHNNKNEDILIIVDVQESFGKFFTKKYVSELKEYCKEFDRVYQIWDNHVDGSNVDKDYLYDETPEVPVHDDLYNFPNQKELIEKRYNYDVDADFYKKVLDEETYKDVSNKEDNKELKRGDFFHTKEGTIIVYIGNNHKWFHMPKKLYELFIEITEAQVDDQKEVTIVGGADSECLLDVEVAAKSMGVKFKRNDGYIYSASNCPIK